MLARELTMTMPAMSPPERFGVVGLGLAAALGSHASQRGARVCRCCHVCCRACMSGMQLHSLVQELVTSFRPAIISAESQLRHVMAAACSLAIEPNKP